LASEDAYDCHSQLSVKMLSSFEREPIMEHMNKFPNGYMWNDSSAESFLKSFSHPEILNQLKSFMDEKIELDNQSINKATETLHNIPHYSLHNYSSYIFQHSPQMSDHLKFLVDLRYKGQLFLDL
jgi:hypothetical protein